LRNLFKVRIIFNLLGVVKQNSMRFLLATLLLFGMAASSAIGGTPAVGGWQDFQNTEASGGSSDEAHQVDTDGQKDLTTSQRRQLKLSHAPNRKNGLAQYSLCGLPKPVRAQGTWQDFSEGHLQYIHRYFLF
jgi:hypothetical protein